MQRSLIVGLLVTGAVLSACRTENNMPPPPDAVGMDVIIPGDVPAGDVPGVDVPPGTDVPVGPDTPVPPDMPQQKIQTTITNIQDRMAAEPVPVGSLVRLSGVVALTRKTFISKRNQGTGCLYGIWVADAAGGPFSGIQVVAAGNDIPQGQQDCPRGNDPASGGPIPADAAIGDTFDIVGKYEEFILTTESTVQSCMMNAGRTCTATYSQITAPFPNELQMTRTGTGTAPAPNVLSDMEINDLKVRGELNPTVSRYRGSLVQLNNVTVSCPNIGFGTTVLNSTNCTNSSFKNDMFTPGTPGDGVLVQGQQDFDYNLNDQDYMADEVLVSITGVLNYNQFDGGWRIVPRQMSDVVRQ